jgi:hypothetical protein
MDIDLTVDDETEFVINSNNNDNSDVGDDENVSVHSSISSVSKITVINKSINSKNPHPSL